MLDSYYILNVLKYSGVLQKTDVLKPQKSQGPCFRARRNQHKR